MCPGGWGVPGIPGLLPPLITNGVPGYAKTGLWGIPPPDGKKRHSDTNALSYQDIKWIEPQLSLVKISHYRIICFLIF